MTSVSCAIRQVTRLRRAAERARRILAEDPDLSPEERLSDGWSTSPYDPHTLRRVGETLWLQAGFALHAYVFWAGSNGISGAVPADAPLVTPDGRDAPICQDTPSGPICQDTPSGGLDDLLTSAEVGHDALVNLSREEAFQAADDVAFGPARGEASGDVVAGRLVEWHPDDDGSIEGRVGVSVAASIEAVPTGGHPRRGRDRAGAAELREGGLRTNPVGVIAEDDQQLSRGVGAHTEALAEGR